MDHLTPEQQKCMTADERAELEAAWKAVQPFWQSLGQIIEGPEQIDCDALHESFLQLADTFDEVERLIMRAKQFRLMQATHGGQQAD